ncbi:M23 family metallopeptidase [Curtobacterium sp. UCD-KPL2560]|uniref:M23 family metallopeptidase n=1 Tax=Curtobacterium sp. UCD-KPL2560 TaxID=1885315 RepID=UPI0008268E28|nr:M23 family metallopeptidase [Curtobacterium sp. UCD-KPL2560]
MPHAPLPSTRPDATTGPEPVVHLTRRARIEAERRTAAVPETAASDEGGLDASAFGRTTFDTGEFDRLVAPGAPAAPGAAAAPVSPVDLAPASPVLPEPVVGAVTPPAPTSPVPAPEQHVAPERTASPEGRTSPERRSATDAGPRRVLGQVPAGRRAARTTSPAPERRRGTAPARTTPVAQSAARGTSFRRNASRVTAVGALLFAAGLVVSTSLPAQALWVANGDTTTERTPARAAQTLSVGGSTAAAETTRDQYSVSATTQYKNVDSSAFSNDPGGAIQWPFLTGVPITSGFGGRQVAGCSFCSTNHMGIDFAPGEGTPIRSVAAGTVIKVQAHDGGFGNDVWVQHDVDGKRFVSVYGHMKDNTFTVVKGQEVEVGDVLGQVGSTGNSTGPHLHLEIHVDGVPVDPLAWLKANAS